MESDGKRRVRLDYMFPARGLIGFQNEFRTLTQGTGLLFHVFDHYGPREAGAIAKRQNGVMIANAAGATPAYSLGPLEERGKLFAAEGDNVYEGRSEEHTSELQSLMRISYAVFCLTKKKKIPTHQ